MKIYLLTLCFCLCAYSWTSGNNPNYFESDLELKFNSLPSDGSLTDNFTAWPGSHWPSFLGGISNRWSKGNRELFTYKTYSLEELKKLEQHQIDELSPAEKYDILMSRFDYPTVRRVRRETSPRNPEWFGICHGIAPAALNHPEPMQVEVQSEKGINLKFYSSDMKGLLGYQYAKIKKSRIKFLGKRCSALNENYVRRRNRRACADIDPGAFHLILANQIGLKKKTFIADVDAWSEVWNHVAHSFQSDVYEEYDNRVGATRGAVKSLWVGTAVTYAGAMSPYFEAVIGTDKEVYMDHNYQYYLDLDENGEIIGGEWISDLRPDFIWSQESVSFTGYWDKLNEIYIPRTQL